MVGGAGGAGGAVGGAVAWQHPTLKTQRPSAYNGYKMLQVASQGYARSIYGGDAGLGTSIKRL